MTPLVAIEAPHPVGTSRPGVSWCLVPLVPALLQSPIRRCVRSRISLIRTSWFFTIPGPVPVSPAPWALRGGCFGIFGDDGHSAPAGSSLQTDWPPYSPWVSSPSQLPERLQGVQIKTVPLPRDRGVPYALWPPSSSGWLGLRGESSIP